MMFKTRVNGRQIRLNITTLKSHNFIVYKLMGLKDKFIQGLSIERVKNLNHMLKTLVGQCRIYLHTKFTFKIYD